MGFLFPHNLDCHRESAEKVFFVGLTQTPSDGIDTRFLGGMHLDLNVEIILGINRVIQNPIAAVRILYLGTTHIPIENIVHMPHVFATIVESPLGDKVSAWLVLLAPRWEGRCHIAFERSGGGCPGRATKRRADI